MSLRRIAGAVASAPAAGRAQDADRYQHPSRPNSNEFATGQQPLLSGYEDDGMVARIQQDYGAIERPGSSSRRSSRRASPEFHRSGSTLNIVPEEEHARTYNVVEEPEEMEYDLEERGLYSGSYRRTVAMYTFVPLTSLMLLVLLSISPDLFWKTSTPNRTPHSPYFPSPLPELLLSASLWSFAYLLRVPLYAIISSVLQQLSPLLCTISFNIVYVVFYNLLRLASLPILHVRDDVAHKRPTWRDPAFRTVWWLGLGWATVDVVVGIAQSYSQIALYRNVMVPEERVPELLACGDGIESQTPHLVTSSQEILPLSPRHEGPKSDLEAPKSLDEAIRLAVDQDLEQLVNLKEREEVEEIFGIPIIKIPVIVSCLQRIDSILLSTGITLTLSASYLHSALSMPYRDLSLLSISSSNKPFIIAFPSILLLNLCLNLLHTPLILPRIGVHTTAYVGFLLGLGSFFVGLGLWGALA